MTKNTSIDPIIPILGLGVVIRLVSINQSLWLDEATTAIVSRSMSLQEILSNFITHDFHPPLYYLLLKIWVQLFGSSEIAIRIPSLLAGVGTILVLYKIGKYLFSKEVGIIAALLLATAPLHIYYSQEARMYSLAAFFVSLLFYVWLIALKNIKEKKWWIYYSLIFPLVFFTDYVSTFIVVPLFVITFIFYKKSFKYFLASHIPFIVGLILFFPILSQQLKSGASIQTNASNWWQILGQSNIKNFLLVPVKFLIGRISISSKIIYASSLVIFSVINGVLIFLGRKEKNFQKVFYWLVLPIISLAIVGFIVPAFSYFRLLFCLPALYLLISVGITKTSTEYFVASLTAVLLINLICSYTYLSKYKFQREDWRDLVTTIEANSNGDATVAFVANSQMEAYRYYAHKTTPIPANELSGNSKTVWLVKYVSDIFDPNNLAQKKIEDMQYKKESEFSFNGIVVWKYNKAL